MLIRKSSVSFLTVLLVLSTFLTFCQKSQNNDVSEGSDKPGKIPGMGNHAGEPTGTPFVLPRGVSLKGTIKGNEDPAASNNCTIDGSGESVMVKFTLQRDSIGNSPLTVIFPPGLIIVSASESHQHGLLVEKVVVRLPPKNQSSDNVLCNVSMLLQCLNKEKSPSDAFASYHFGPVTNSKTILSFLSKISSKKISYSDYNQDGDAWRACGEYLQSALWHITEGEGLTEEDLEFIQNLPNKQ